MWTPRRIVFLSICFVAFFLTYLGYAYTAVGRIDGLPPLPEGYGPAEKEDDAELVHAPDQRNGLLMRKMRLAFGAGAKQLDWAIRLDISSRGMVLAAEQFEIREGRVYLRPVSIALLSKERNDGQPPEIRTIHGDQAYLKFDRPVTNFSEMASRKVTEAELSGRIEVVSNRRRLQRDQDLRVTIPTGTLYYHEPTQRLWTEAYVTLEDFKVKPQAHKITGKGMEMELLTDAPSNPGASKGGASITGVKWVSLLSTVRMDLYLEGGNSLIASKPQEKPVAPPSPGPAQRSHLLIETPGRFRYDLHKDHDLATFEIRPATAVNAPRASAILPAIKSRAPEHVTVTRTNLQTKLTDHLVCQRLQLRLRRKDADKDAPQAKKEKSDSTTDGLEIETIHATAPPGKSVVLVSNADRLSARGLDFFHDAVRETTIMKGDVEVDKDDSRLHARAVRVQTIQPPKTTVALKPGQPLPKAYQHVIAKGPGDILSVDRKQKKSMRGYWREEMVSTRDGAQDLMILTGEARFVDEQTGQSLKGDVLKVWLDPAEPKPATSPGQAQGSEGRRPRHLEATATGKNSVVARSTEVNIHDTGRLVVWFKDADGPAGPLPPPKPATKQPAVGPAAPSAEPPVATLPRPLPTGPERPPAHLTSKPAAPPRAQPVAGPALGAPDKREPARPFDLSARSVEAWVIRRPDKSEIDQLWCEGSVHVRQDPARAEEKGTEVKGDTLRMVGTGEGNYNLVVTGDLAELQTDKIYIIGPEVNIEQATNKAWVVGDGAMKMDSKNSFQGETLEKPVPLTVHWSKSMLFNGESAEFYGNIQAVQEKARLACQRMQVYFDKPISLKQGNKTNEPASVKDLVCSRDVRVEDCTFEGDKIVKYQRLEGPAVQMKALEPDAPVAKPALGTRAKSAGNVVFASGPGNVRIWEPGSPDESLSANAPRPKSAAKKSASQGEMRMTYVAFQKRMDANSKTNTALFWENVRVLHLPCPRHDTPIDLDLVLAADLPENSLYIRSDRLKVLDSIESGKPNKQLLANGKVYVQGRDFWARADAVSYNQQKQQIILDGKESGNATLYKVTSNGAKPETVEAKRIIYNRATGEIAVQKAESISGDSVPK